MPDGLKEFVRDIEGLVVRNKENGPTVATAISLLRNIAGTFDGDIPPELSVSGGEMVGSFNGKTRSTNFGIFAPE